MAEKNEKDICGYCLEPGADKMALWTGGGKYCPGEFVPETELVHQACEQKETNRAFNTLTKRTERAGFKIDPVREGLTLSVCPNGCCPEAVIVIVDYTHDPDVLGVLIDVKTKKATGKWGDGSEGVPPEVQAIAEAISKAICPTCLDDCLL